MDQSLYMQVETLQNMLVAEATGGNAEEADYSKLRLVMISNVALAALVPRFVHTNRDLSQFWQYIKHKFSTYKERRDYIWSEFRPLLDRLERGGAGPADSRVTGVLESYDAEHVQDAWTKALERRGSDPQGAITSARTLLESICKHILDDRGVEYNDKDDLPKLYKLTAESLNLAPSQHTAEVFKQILGGCTAVVEGLGTLRNRLSDAHGKGKNSVKPASRHAELAINLSGALAMFLLSTHDALPRR